MEVTDITLSDNSSVFDAGDALMTIEPETLGSTTEPQATTLGTSAELLSWVNDVQIEDEEISDVED